MKNFTGKKKHWIFSIDIIQTYEKKTEEDDDGKRRECKIRKKNACKSIISSAIHVLFNVHSSNSLIEEYEIRSDFFNSQPESLLENELSTPDFTFTSFLFTP